MNKKIIEMKKNTTVSMNFWGFTPDYFKYSEEFFKQFLEVNINNPSAEFLIPAVVNDLIKKQQIKVKVLNSHAEWFGVTYQKDKAFVTDKLMKLINKGVYPMQLWK